jgi:hypothetical protein
MTFSFPVFFYYYFFDASLSSFFFFFSSVFIRHLLTQVLGDSSYAIREKMGDIVHGHLPRSPFYSFLLLPPLVVLLATWMFVSASLSLLLPPFLFFSCFSLRPLGFMDLLVFRARGIGYGLRTGRMMGDGSRSRGNACGGIAPSLDGLGCMGGDKIE